MTSPEAAEFFISFDRQWDALPIPPSEPGATLATPTDLP